MSEKESKAIAQLSELCNKNIAVSFSGGKDSLVVLDLAMRVGIKKAVFCDTSIEFEETLRYIGLIREFYNIDLKTVSSPTTFFQMIKNVGIPSRRARWCCDVFKFAPLTKYAVENNLYGFITGLRRNESKRRSDYEFIDDNPLVPVKQINPILDWTSQDVWDYILAYNLPYNPLYDHFKRIGCWCCPYRTKQEWKRIEELFPDMVKQFKNELQLWADELKIRDTNKFINERGWTAWISPVRKIQIGANIPCQGNNNGETTMIFNAEQEKYIRRITKLLPVLTDDFFPVGKKLRITVDGINKVKLNILIEKAINCVGCGACLSLCKYDALHIDNESIYVDNSKCVHCEKCLSATDYVLRGGCIIRNYAPQRLILINF